MQYRRAGRKTLVHQPAGIYLAFSFIWGLIMRTEKVLSVFIDESGDFGEYDFRSPYYMVSMVFHNQQSYILDDIAALDRRVANLGFPPHAIHVGPIVRRESIYEKYDSFEKRLSLLNALYHFTRKIDIRYLCPFVKKSECVDFLHLNAKLSREISSQLKQRMDYFDSFDRIIVYYDNGQHELTRILTTVFNTLFDHVEFRKVDPADYKLFQVADLICYWEMLNLKAEHNAFSSSETEFFESPRDFRRNRLKLIRKKML